MRAWAGLFGVRVGLVWVGFMLLWLLFVFQFSIAEVLVGAAASALTVFAVQVALHCIPLCFEPRWHWIAQAWRLPESIARDLWIMTKAFFGYLIHKPAHGRFQLERFDTAGEDCHGSAQRALSILFLSLSPNSVVLSIDGKRGEMLIHQLTPQPVSKLARKLQE